MLEAEQGELGVPGGRAVRGSVGVPLDSRIFKIQYRPQALPGVRRASLSLGQRMPVPQKEQRKKLLHGDSDPEGPGGVLSLTTVRGCPVCWSDCHRNIRNRTGTIRLDTDVVVSSLEV